MRSGGAVEGKMMIVKGVMVGGGQRSAVMESLSLMLIVSERNR